MGGDGACSQWTRRRVQVGSAGGHSSRQVGSDLHISLWKRARLDGEAAGLGRLGVCSAAGEVAHCVLARLYPFRTPFSSK